MRETIARLLGEDAEPPSPEELETLLMLLRGHLMVTIPEVATAALKLHAKHPHRSCANACIGEARMKLNAEPSGNSLPAGIAYAQKLARVLEALLNHLGKIEGGEA